MPDHATLPQVASLALQLPAVEQKQLAETILRDLAAESQTLAPPRRRSWREIRGRAPYPLCDEDAQAWVTRGRRESAERREAAQGDRP